MKIKINEVKVSEIDAAFTAINGKAVAHTASHHEVFELAAKMEAKLDSLGIPKKDRAGAIAHGMSGGSVASAYKYSRTVIRYFLERKSSDWFLVGAVSTDIYGDSSSPSLSLTPAQRDIALAKFSKQFTVQGV